MYELTRTRASHKNNVEIQEGTKRVEQHSEQICYRQNNEDDNRRHFAHFNPVSSYKMPHYITIIIYIENNEKA